MLPHVFHEFLWEEGMRKDVVATVGSNIQGLMDGLIENRIWHVQHCPHWVHPSASAFWLCKQSYGTSDVSGYAHVMAGDVGRIQNHFTTSLAQS